MTDHFFNTCSTCRNLFALLGLAMLLSCTEKGQTEKENGMLEAVLVKQYAYSIKDTTDLLVGRLRYSFKANLIADRFAFYDETQKRILVTDSLGNVLTVIGGEGKGPKEFVKVMGYTFDEHNNMVVLDGGQYLVKIFDLEGNPIHAFEPEQENISLAGWAMEARNDRILFGAIEPRYLAQLPNAEGSKMIAAYGYSGELLDTFGQYDSLTNKSKNYVIFPKIALDEEGNHIYTIRSTGYTIQEWNLNTKDRTMVFHQKPVHFQEPRRKISPHWPREKIGKESTGSSFIVDLIVGGEYVYMYYQNLTEEWKKSTTKDHYTKDHFVAIYSREGALLAEIKLDFLLGNIIDGKLHLVENDDPDAYTIGVYGFTLR